MEKVAKPKTPNVDLMARLVQDHMLPAAQNKLAAADVRAESEEQLIKSLVIGHDVANAVQQKAASLGMGPAGDPMDVHAQKIASLLVNTGASQQDPTNDERLTALAGAAFDAPASEGSE